MKSIRRTTAALAAAALIFCGASLRALEDTAPAKPAADKNTPPAEVTTPGEVNANGQHIAYSAIAGTITVGATDDQDAQLGPDGKPQPGSQLALNEPKDP